VPSDRPSERTELRGAVRCLDSSGIIRPPLSKPQNMWKSYKNLFTDRNQTRHNGEPSSLSPASASHAGGSSPIGPASSAGRNPAEIAQSSIQSRPPGPSARARSAPSSSSLRLGSAPRARGNGPIETASSAGDKPAEIAQSSIQSRPPGPSARARSAPSSSSLSPASASHAGGSSPIETASSAGSAPSKKDALLASSHVPQRAYVQLPGRSAPADRSSLVRGFLVYVDSFLLYFKKGQHEVSQLKRKALPVEKGGIEIFTQYSVEQLVNRVERDYETVLHYEPVLAQQIQPRGGATSLIGGDSNLLRPVPGPDSHWVDVKQYGRSIAQLQAELASGSTAPRPDLSPRGIAALQTLARSFNTLHETIRILLREAGFPHEPVNIKRFEQFQARGHIAEISAQHLLSRADEPRNALYLAHRVSRGSEGVRELLADLRAALDGNVQVQKKISGVIQRAFQQGGSPEGMLIYLGLERLPEEERNSLVATFIKSQQRPDEAQPFYAELLEVLSAHYE
jgi:hypothetical protein